MTDIPESMVEELGAWNDGKGIDLEAWAGCSGSFRLAVGYGALLWPQFEEVGPYILVKECTAENISSFESVDGATPQGVEAVLNHEHLADLQFLGCDDISADKLVFLGSIMKEMYEAKLHWQFPGRPCSVDLFIPEDRDDFIAYELTFWQAKWTNSGAVGAV